MKMGGGGGIATNNCAIFPKVSYLPLSVHIQFGVNKGWGGGKKCNFKR